MTLDNPTDDLSPTRPTRIGMIMVGILGCGVVIGALVGVLVLREPQHSFTVDAFVTISSSTSLLKFTAGLIGGAAGGGVSMLIILVIAVVRLVRQW